MKITSTHDTGNSPLTASGAAVAVNSATTFVHEISQSPDPHSQARINVGGTFTGSTLKADGLSPSGTLWIPLLLVSNAGTRNYGSDTPADSTNTSWTADIRGFGKIRVYNSAGTITSMTVEVVTGTQAEFGGTLSSITTTSGSAFTGGNSFTGGTGVNITSFPDNLASGWSLNEGSNKYVEAISTNGSEQWKIYKNTVWVDGITVVNSANTTGTSIWGASDKGGFFGATPVVKQATFTQTYSTASATVAADTSHTITDSTGGSVSTTALAALTVNSTLTDSTGGSASTTLASVGAGASYLQADQVAIKNALASLAARNVEVRAALVVIQNTLSTLAAELVLVKADALNTKKNVNSVVDAFQAYGLVG